MVGLLGREARGGVWWREPVMAGVWDAVREDSVIKLKGIGHVNLRVADLVLDPASREVLRGEERVSLTRTEYNLLERLMYRAGKVVSRRALIESVWGFDRDIEENTLDAFMHLLRNKIDSPGRPKLIQTVRGVGYMIRPDGTP